MMELSFDLKEEIEIKLKKIFDLYSDKEIFAKNIIEYEISELKKSIINIQIDLNHFENKYNLLTIDFYKKFESGELDDIEDYIIWAGIYEMLIQNNKRLAELE